MAENTWDMTVDIPLVTFVTDFNLNITLKALYVPIYGKGRCHGKISEYSKYNLKAVDSERSENRIGFTTVRICLPAKNFSTINLVPVNNFIQTFFWNFDLLGDIEAISFLNFFVVYLINRIHWHLYNIFVDFWVTSATREKI